MMRGLFYLAWYQLKSNEYLERIGAAGKSFRSVVNDGMDEKIAISPTKAREICLTPLQNAQKLGTITGGEMACKCPYIRQSKDSHFQSFAADISAMIEGGNSNVR